MIPDHDKSITPRSAPRRRIVKNMDAPDCVRVYRYSPEDIALQIRLKDQFVFQALSFAEAKELVAAIEYVRGGRE
jgi:hypothetical protein